jgi:hypothetical protein
MILEDGARWEWFDDTNPNVRLDCRSQAPASSSAA